MKKNFWKRDEKWLLLLLIISFSIMFFFLYTNTNLFVVQQNSVYHKTINVGLVSDPSGVVLFKLLRNDKTPIVLDWASLNNNQSFTYVMRGDELIINIHVPITDSGWYFLDYKLGKEKHTIKFYVR